MKKILATIAVAVFTIYPSICFASYVIHLKDGGEFVTDRYWKEGDQIKFKRYGGTIGIQKDRIRRIEKVKNVPENVGDEDKTQEVGEKETAGKGTKTGAKSKGIEGVKLDRQSDKPVPHSGKKESGYQEEQAEKDKSEEKPDDEQLDRNQRIALSRRVREALESYKRAKAVGDREKINREFRRVSRISSELEDLEKKVRAKNDGTLPSWWREEDENRE